MGIIIVFINNHMVVIQIQVPNTIEDVFLDGGSNINIIMKQLHTKLHTQTKSYFIQSTNGRSNHYQTYRFDQRS